MLRCAAIIIFVISLTGCTVSLIQASKEGDLTTVKKYVEGTTNPSDESDKCTAMGWAAANGHLEIVQYLSTSGKVNVNCNLGAGWTPLLQAAGADQMEIVKYLIERGARVNSKTMVGSSPLTAAARNGLSDMARLLLSKGADLDEAIAYLKGELVGNPQDTGAKNGLILLQSFKAPSAPVSK